MVDTNHFNEKEHQNMNNTQALIKHIAQGNTVKYLHFWGHQQKGQSVDKSCFSQWFPATFVLDGTPYLTAEHYMMAQKARLFNDQQNLDAILQCATPVEAKKLGRQVLHFDHTLWNAHCFDYVVQGNIGKFAQNPALKMFLLNTKERVLVEASPRDRIWGIGMGSNNPNACNPEQWRGKNQLGFALMAARDVLRKGEQDV
jgi:ribA/ribD-fused uncharacterized protein